VSHAARVLTSAQRKGQAWAVMLSPAELGRRVVDEARALGFHRVGLVPVEASAAHGLYQAWLAAGHHGEMAYLASPEHADGRRHPHAILPGARTLVVVALSYARPDGPVPLGLRGTIARYARGADYHHVFKEKLDALAARLRQEVPGLLARACVDTAPLLERDAAERAGLGFVAKNTMLIAPGLGSYVLLGELLLDVEARMEDLEPARKRCGSCRACLDACPTGAFVEAGVLDARRCISYLTIELVGAIPRELRPLIGRHVFGCDICQEVCPFNAADRRDAAPELAPLSAERGTPDLLQLVQLGSNQFRHFVKQSALRRVHRAQLLRNVCVALGNAGDPRAIEPLRARLADSHPLVREHAAWALGRLGDREGLRRRVFVETDPRVREELELSLLDLDVPPA
jgi:epoxyqueuosine reductase